VSAALSALPGALVISLDFELHWGVRDIHPAEGSYRQTLLAARDLIPELLRLFEEFEVAATWATVGFLFAASREELERFSPRVRPAYADPVLDPYGEPVGSGESEDPIHYAPSLIRAIQVTPGQEIATHTFSHYYCLEAGQTKEAFRADLEAARAIAAQRGIRLRSIVFPRNQYNPDYDEVLHSSGITCYRGNQRGSMYRESTGEMAITRGKRTGRMLDSYLKLSGDTATPWSQVRQPNGLANVPASAFLRRYRPRLRRFEALRLARIRGSMRRAARAKRIYHLWSHPHTFGVHVEENLRFLRRVLEEFSVCREGYGMRSLSMADVERQVAGVLDHGHGASTTAPAAARPLQLS
jgi:peptidoglycan/xylan/chitin deacetylase (PgdA/CDA1 family)